MIISLVVSKVSAPVVKHVAFKVNEKVAKDHDRLNYRVQARIVRKPAKTPEQQNML